MNKKDVQKRVLQDGKPLALSKFTWCEETRTFSSLEERLVLDFSNISHCTIEASSHCTIKTGADCTIKTFWDCTINTGSSCTIEASSHCTIEAGADCTIKTFWDCTINTGSSCTIEAGAGCTIKTFWDCTINTGAGCTIEAGADCTIEAGSNCVIIRRDEFEVIQPKENEIIQLCPYGIPGYLIDGLYNGEPHIIADGILSKVVNKKGNVYKVINHGEASESYLVTDGEHWAHGATLKQAREDLIFKAADNADKSAYEGLTLDTVKTPTEWAVCYRAITGACVTGIKGFMGGHDLKESYSLEEIIAETANAYGGSEFKGFFIKEG